MEINSVGSSIGKANIAVRLEFCEVLEAMAATKVSIADKPILPKINMLMKSDIFSIGLPMRRLSNAKDKREMISIKKLLNINFDKISGPAFTNP